MSADKCHAHHPPRPPQLAALRLTVPTEVQRVVIPALLAGGHAVVASHTGSGKARRLAPAPPAPAAS